MTTIEMIETMVNNGGTLYIERVGCPDEPFSCKIIGGYQSPNDFQCSLGGSGATVDEAVLNVYERFKTYPATTWEEWQ